MPCERPGGPFIDMVRDDGMKFGPDYNGELPPPMTREQLRQQFAKVFQSKGFSPDQVEGALDFFEAYEQKYYEPTTGPLVGRNFHRPCGGGAMKQGETGVFCSKCGKLEDLIPPSFLRG